MTSTKQVNPLGAWLREKRTAKGWSMDVLVERANYVCSKAFISQLENNKYTGRDGQPMTPDIEIVDSLAMALGESRNEARRLANYAPTQDEMSTDEVAEEFTYALSRFRQLSTRGKQFFTKHIGDTLDFLIEVDTSTGGEGQTIRFAPMSDVPEITVAEADKMRKRGRKKDK